MGSHLNHILLLKEMTNFSRCVRGSASTWDVWRDWGSGETVGPQLPPDLVAYRYICPSKRCLYRVPWCFPDIFVSGEKDSIRGCRRHQACWYFTETNWMGRKSMNSYDSCTLNPTWNPILSQESDLLYPVVRLINSVVVEWHCLDGGLRQFDLRGITRRSFCTRAWRATIMWPSRGITRHRSFHRTSISYWATRYASWIVMWDQHRHCLVIRTPQQGPMLDDNPYMVWHQSIIRHFITHLRSRSPPVLVRPYQWCMERLVLLCPLS